VGLTGKELADLLLPVAQLFAQGSDLVEPGHHRVEQAAQLAEGIELQLFGKAQQLVVLTLQANVAPLVEQLAFALYRQLVLEFLPVAFAGGKLERAVLIEFGAYPCLAQAAVETAQDLLVAHLVIEHHGDRLGQLATAAEQQRLAPGLTNRLERLQPFQAEAAAHRLGQSQLESGVQRIAGALAALFQ